MANYSPFTFGAGGGFAATSGSGSSGGGFNINPGPQSGNGPFGKVPGPVGAITPAQVGQPPDPFAQLSKLYPNLSGANTASSDFIGSELGGHLSTGTTNALTNLSAERGISSGMGPRAGLWDNALLGNVAGATEALQQHGLSDFDTFIANMAKNQTITPELQAQINTAQANLDQQAKMANLNTAERNSVMGAAPDPAAAQSYAQQLFQKYLGSMGGGGGSTWASQHHPASTTYTGGGGFGSGATFGGFGQDMTQGGYGPAYMNSGGWNGSASSGASPAMPSTPAGGNLYSGNWGDNSPGVYMGANDKPWMSDPFGDVMDPANGDFGGF